MAQNYNHKQDGSRSVSLSELTKDELVAEVIRLRGQLKKKDSFGLVFERQKEDAILNRAKTIPMLKENKSKHVNNGGEDNLLLVGDNFDSLTCLLETHKGKIDVIYIDPPYNTGNKDFKYNDNYVNDEDSYRHSKWLSFMEKRLILSKELLSASGIIFVSIDDNEHSHLKLLMDSIFGEENFITSAPRKTSAIVRTSSELQVLHDYLLMYKSSGDTELSKVQSGEKVYDLEDSNGKYRLVPFWNSGPDSTREARPNLFYDFYLLKDGTVTLDESSSNIVRTISPEKGRWLWSKAKFEQDKGLIVINDKGMPYTKRYFQEGEDTATYSMPKTWLDDFMNAKGSKSLTSLLGKESFSYPKPVDFMKWLINLIPNKKSLVLDFFAGSGTTGHAVLDLNKEDGGNRKFILCTNDEAGIGDTVTYERVKRVITGKDWADGKDHESREASLRYFNVGFVERANIAKELADNVDSLISITENCFEEIASEDMFKVWKNNNNRYCALIKDSWGIEGFIESLNETEPATISIYVDDNSADYSIELESLQQSGWDINYISLDDFILDVIAFVDEKVGVNSIADGNNTLIDTDLFSNETINEESGENN